MDTKKLRQKILDLAIRGKLVPQDPNDEPASVLLERIRAEKERLIKEGKIKRSKKSASDDEIEAPFEIPESWEWTTIGELCDVVRGGSPRPAGSKEFYDGPIPFLKVADLTHDEGIYVYMAQNSIKEAGLSKTRMIEADTLLLTNSGATLGVPKINTFPTTINDGIAAFLFLSNDIKLYVYWFLKSKTNSFRRIDQGAAQPNLNTDLIKAEQMPLPPLSEQRRIINEVERWFTLIDELESNESDLLKTIDKAKSKILDLAIHGKLVPQDPNDEPAIDLLKRINPKFETCSDSLYETLPNGWEVCIMNDIASSELGKTLDKEKNKGEYKPYLCSINVFWNHFVLNEMKQMRFEINELEHYSIHQGDLVICEGGDAGRCAVWPNSYSVLFQNAIHRVRFKENIDSYFYMYVIMYLKNKHILDNYCKGVTIKHFTKTALLSLPVPLPPINEQLRIVAKIEELFAVLDGIKESLE